VSYARRAADVSTSSADKGLAHARLGAVLLGQVELNDAIVELNAAIRELKLARRIDDPAYDETNWMLAQAYLCSGNNDDKARPLLDEIAGNEQARDRTSFTGSSFLDTLLPGSDSEHPILRCTLGGA
jgi:hypothetical protein